MTRCYELRAKNDLQRLRGKITLEGAEIEFAHGGSTLIVLDEHKVTVLMCMPPPQLKLFEVPVPIDVAAEKT